jgi:hypothetical protein
MNPALVLNHSFLSGLTQRSAADQRTPLVELLATLIRIRKVRNEGTIYVHPDLRSTDVGNGQPFVSWANGLLGSKDWRDILDTLLSLGTGPFYMELAVNSEMPPGDTDPSCRHVPSWLKDMVLRCAHHVLSEMGEAWLLSYGDGVHLTADAYEAQRGPRRGRVPNLRSDAEAEAAERNLSLRRAQTTVDILDAAEKHASRVRVLDKARDSARRYGQPIPSNLLPALIGLDQYANALDAGESRELAAQIYHHAIGVEMSGEKSATLRKPSLKECRTFVLPNGTPALFDMHAKPGEMRVHVHACKEPVDPNNPDSGEHTVVYVGHCGEHLPLK